MKCEIALGFLHDPKIMLLDEPSIGRDCTAKRGFREILTTVAINSNKTILLTSHDMNDIEQVCSRFDFIFLLFIPFGVIFSFHYICTSAV